MTVLDLKAIVSLGGCIVVNANDYSILDLKSIASLDKKLGGKLYIKNANRISALDCKALATLNPGNITFDFSNNPNSLK